MSATPQVQIPTSTGQLKQLAPGLAGTAATAYAGSSAFVGGALTAGSATIVGAIVAVAVLIILKLFKGADPRQVPAAKIEQMFEAAADNLYALWANGMITRNEANAGMDWLSQAGTQFFTQHPNLFDGNFSSGPGSRGVRNMQQVIQAEKVPATPVKIKVEKDVALAHTFYPNLPIGPGHWYKEGVQMGQQLADEYVDALPKNFGTAAALDKVTTALGDVTSGDPHKAGGILGILLLFLVGGLLLKGLLKLFT